MANKTKLLSLVFGLTMCLALMFGIVFAGDIVARADDGEKTTIENVGVSFNKTKIGDKLVSMFQFEDETTKTLVVPEGANYTARIDVIFAYGHTRRLWSDAPGYLWSTIENSEITRDTPYVVRVAFAPKTGYIFDASKEAEYLSTINIPGFEIGKGKDIEVWATNLGEYYFNVDFVVTKGMNHMFGWSLNAYPKIGEPVSSSLCTPYTDTAFWLVGAPAPYTFEKKIAPVGTIVETQKSEILNTYVCNYQITAVNAMDGGTMYITATAADGQTCDIPIQVYSVSGGHEHTWVEEIEPIGNDHHGYTKCTAEDCPGVACQFDKGSRYSTHDYAYGCNVKCGTCGHVNPEGKHTYIWQFDVEDTEYHISKCRCGEVEKDENGNVVKDENGNDVIETAPVLDKHGKPVVDKEGNVKYAPVQARDEAGVLKYETEEKVYDIARMPLKDMSKIRGRQIAMIFQEPMTSLNPVFTIGNQLDEVTLLHIRDADKAEAKRRSLEMLELVGIAMPERVYKSYPHEISGGMRQRVMIAMALACNPRLVIADEPTTALDVTIQAQILDLLRDVRKKMNGSIMLITHDLGVIAEMADYVYVMYAGKVVEQGTAQEIFKNPLHPYTIGLQKSKPVVGKEVDELYSIPGNVPNPVNMPDYCYFRERCNACTEKCAGKYPAFVKVSPTHGVACYKYTDKAETDE